LSDDDLDFTKPPKSPPVPPSPQKVADARREASTGGPELARSGVYIAKSRQGAGKREPRGGDRYLVFVVEDDRDMTTLVSEVLAAEGFLTRTARNRNEINIEFNRPPMPDLILLDVTLPDADGFQILERIRGNPRIAHIPVVMLTGKSEEADIARGLALGADGYVTKPFRVTGLTAAVKAVLGLE
jgi:two-component system, OmpR family, response regulator